MFFQSKKMLQVFLLMTLYISGVIHGVFLTYSPQQLRSHCCMSAWWHKLSVKKKILVGTVSLATIGAVGYWLYIRKLRSMPQNWKIEKSDFSTLIAWTEGCKKLPFNRQKLEDKDSGFLALKDITNSFNPFEDKLFAWYKVKAMCRVFCEIRSDQLQKSRWYEEKQLPYIYDNTTIQNNEITFVQKKIVPVGDQIHFFGDLHGDIHSLIACFKQLKLENKIDDNFVVQPGVHLCFLGDYVDGGTYGVEVIYFLMNLYLINAHNGRVILVRGNHEDIYLNNNFGFENELVNKYQDTGNFAINDAFACIVKFYKLLPVALYLATETDVVLAAHGLCDTKHEFSNFLMSETEYAVYAKACNAHMIDVLKEDQKQLQAYSNNYGISCEPFDVGIGTNGYMQNFCQVDKDAVTEPSLSGGVYSKYVIQAFLDSINKNSSLKIRGIIRAHQHGHNSEHDHGYPMMKLIFSQNRGIAAMWDTALFEENNNIMKLRDKFVITLCVSPDTTYGMSWNFSQYTTCYITVARQFEDWKVAYQQHTIPGLE